ncbi:Hsp33 family molecular chaperone HslO [Marilutibacter alkalisoli]|uniref:Hsp33 family molecular chaperone HslO n=1 Tax=Marilutibacter alkalisoli TaxID=2591633 RepID=A0A514BPI7_9GAMM|nr:Hsp33 family molecular chaperone HslO [Lysobacter alkalisoli]
MTTPTDDTGHDRLTRFLIGRAGVRGVHVRLDDTWRQIRSHGDYPPAVAEMLGQACTAAALFTGHTKVDGRLSIQLRGEHALRTLFAECTAAGTLRGIARLDDDAEPPQDLRGIGPGAVLAITIENPATGRREPMRYQGMVGLDADTLGEAFEGYFDQSEQLPTRLFLVADKERACGLMLQKLPGDEGDEDGWNRACALFNTLVTDEMLTLTAEVLLTRLFHEDGVETLANRPLRFACSCSSDRVASMLVSLGEEEALAAAADGEAHVRCEFCGREYRFGRDRIRELFKKHAIELEGPGRPQ